MYTYVDQIFESWDDHLLAEKRQRKHVRDPSDHDVDCMEWYTGVTHLIVQNPAYRFTSCPHNTQGIIPNSQVVFDFKFLHFKRAKWKHVHCYFLSIFF